MADEEDTEVDLDGLLEDTERGDDDLDGLLDDTERDGEDDLGDVVGGDLAEDVLDEIEMDKYDVEEASEAVADTKEGEEETPPAVETVPVDPPAPANDKENNPNTKSPKASKTTVSTATLSTAASSTSMNNKKRTKTNTTLKKKPTTPARKTPSKPRRTTTTTTASPKPKSTTRPKSTPARTRRTPGPKTPKRDEDDEEEPQGPICANTYQPNLHPKRGPCQICVFKLNEKEKAKFEATGRHLAVNVTRGGCAGCKAFPSQEGEDPVRICRQCFFDTHKLTPYKQQPFSGVSCLEGMTVGSSPSPKYFSTF